MEVIQDYKNHLNILGISEETGKLGVVTLMHVGAQSIIIVNLFIYVVFRWEDIDDRFIALKALSVLMITFGYTVSLIWFFDDFSILVHTAITTSQLNVSTKIGPPRLKILHSLEMFMKAINVTWRMLLLSYVGIGFIFPITTVLLNIFLFSEKFQTVILKSYAIPFPWYFPEYFQNFQDLELQLNTLWYTIGYVIESLYLFVSFQVGHLSYSISLSSILNVQTEFKLLSLFVKEMGEVSNDALLERLTRQFVQQHQTTYRKFDTVNKGIRGIAFTVCTTTSLYICLSLYTIVQTDQILKKIHEIVFLVTWVNSLFQFCFFGEMLKNEVEKLRNSLYEYSWVEKPIWFKKSLLIIMARTSRPVDIKPFGLYGFDFKRFSAAMNAVYCYYNVLCNFKNKY